MNDLIIVASFLIGGITIILFSIAMENFQKSKKEKWELTLNKEETINLRDLNRSFVNYLKR